MLARIVLAGALLFCGNALRADVIYSSFGPGQTYSNGTGLVVSDSYDHFVAISFTPQFFYALTGIQVAVSRQTNDTEDTTPDQVTVAIYADAGGLPGLLLESFNLGAPSQSDLFGTSASILAAASTLSPVLAAGGTYWFVTNSPVDAEGSGNVIWNATPNAANGVVRAKNNLGEWLPADETSGLGLGAFQVEGSLIPEPSTWMLAAGAMAGLFAMRRRAAQD